MAKRVDFSLDSGDKESRSPSFRNTEEVVMSIGQGMVGEETFYSVTQDRSNPYSDYLTTNINLKNYANIKKASNEDS